MIGWKNSALAQLLFAAMMAAAGAAVCAGSSAAGAPDYHTYVIEETPEETEPETVPETEPETVPETEPETEPEEVKPSPAADRFNLADVYPEGADPEDPLTSLGGGLFEKLYEKDNSWNQSVFGASSRKPEQVAGQLGRSRASLLGKYNITDEKHNPDDPSTWVVGKWNHIRVDVRDANGTATPEVSNVKQILAMASVYTWYHDPGDTETFSRYANELWKASHKSSMSMSKVYYDTDCLTREAVEKAMKKGNRTKKATSSELEGDAGDAVLAMATASELAQNAGAAGDAVMVQAAEGTAAGTGQVFADPTGQAAALEADLIAEQGNEAGYDNIEEYQECPGHLDLSVKVTVWTMDGEKNLFRLDKIGSSAENMNERWWGWTNQTMEEARRLAESDWYEDYGLSVSLFSKTAPLTEGEIEEQLALLPENLSPERLALAKTALESIGKIPYYWGGKPVSPDYDGNHFYNIIAADYKGRIFRGLDCSGWLTWAYWHGLGRKLPEMSTAGQIHLGRGIRRKNLQTGDIIIRAGTDETIGHVLMFLRWAEDGRAVCVHETGGVTNNVCLTYNTDTGASCRNLLD